MDEYGYSRLSSTEEEVSTWRDRTEEEQHGIEVLRDRKSQEQMDITDLSKNN